MIQPWSERQRQALRTFRQAIARRAERERVITQESHERQRTTELRYQTEKARVEGEIAAALAGALAHAEQSRQQLHERQEHELNNLQGEHLRSKDKLVQNDLEAKHKLESDFREARWTTSTVYDADKRVAKEQMQESMSACKNLLRKLLHDWREGRALLLKLEFLEDRSEE